MFHFVQEAQNDFILRFLIWLDPNTCRYLDSALCHSVTRDFPDWWGSNYNLLHNVNRVLTKTTLHVGVQIHILPTPRPTLVKIPCIDFL